MKTKKDKNASVQISLYNIFDQVSKPQNIAQYKNSPHLLADQIDDLKTLLNFAATNYTNKAKNLLNMTKQFTKSIETTIDAVNILDAPLYQMPQYSYPELAYETLKRSTTLDLEEENGQLDWRAVYSEYQLKFMESKNICSILNWEKCYNSQERCIQIFKSSNEVVSHHLKQPFQKPIQIDLTLKIEGPHILWHVKKVLFHNNLHYPLLSYYQTELMTWLKEHHNNNLEESEKHVLSLLHKSIDYVDVILLFIELKNTSYNQNVDSLDMKNGIFNLFDEQQTLKSSYLKGKNIKICFMLPYSVSPPSIIIRVDGLNVLKIQFTQKNEIEFKIKLKNKKQQMTMKKLTGRIKKKRLSLEVLLSIVHQILECLQTYEGFVTSRVEQFKMDIFLTNRTTNLIMYLKSVDCFLLEEGITENEAINLKIKYDLSIHHISSSGLYAVFVSLVQTYLPPLIIYISPLPQLSFKTANTQFGFINKLFKNHPSITFEEAMYHNHFLEQVEIHQEKSNWNLKLVYLDIYPTRDIRCQWIIYKFKQMMPKKQTNQSSIIKREARSDHNPMKDYSLHIKIHENFKTVQFIFITPNQGNRSEQTMNGNRMEGNKQPNENEISEKYFKNSWKDYVKRKNESQLHKNQYLDIDQLLKSTHYILNHLDFNRYIKGKSSIFRTEDMVQLMDS